VGGGTTSPRRVETKKRVNGFSQLFPAKQAGQPETRLLPQLLISAPRRCLDREADQRLEELGDAFARLGGALVIGRRVVLSRRLLALCPYVNFSLPLFFFVVSYLLIYNFLIEVLSK
jgi:hypothetical protein